MGVLEYEISPGAILKGYEIFGDTTVKGEWCRAYIWAGAIMLEPAWRMRIFETVLMLALLSTFFLSSQMMGYSRGILPLATVTTLAAFPLIHYSVRRFKDGVQ